MEGGKEPCCRFRFVEAHDWHKQEKFQCQICALYTRRLQILCLNLFSREIQEIQNQLVVL